MDEKINPESKNKPSTPNFDQSQFRPYHNPSENSPKRDISKRDIFFMSFFGFLFGGIIIALIALVVDSITGYISLDLLPGEEEVAEELPVIDNTTNSTIEAVNETVEEVVEEEEEEPSDPCNEDLSLTLDEPYVWNDRTIILKLAGDSAAKVSVGGKSSLLSVGETVEINRMDVKLVDSSEASSSAIIQVVC
jgi:hypothetical protein